MDDYVYFRRREKEEIDRATRSKANLAAIVHFELASRYALKAEEALAREFSPRPQSQERTSLAQEQAEAFLDTNQANTRRPASMRAALQIFRN
jgi:hypothetical protein